MRARPHAPAAAGGRLQKAIARCFLVHGPAVSAAVIYDWTQDLAGWPPPSLEHHADIAGGLRAGWARLDSLPTVHLAAEIAHSVANPVASEEIA